ncbi:MAG: diguanylate cyclase, partial [Deinococcota bacterium]
MTSNAAKPKSVSRRVLIVDDQEINLRVFEARLMASGFDVQLAQRAVDAWNMLVQAEDDMLPHLIILDVMMPDVSGFELLDNIKRNARFKYIPVLIVTSLAKARHRARAFALGADDFLTKPINASELLARVRYLTDVGQFSDRETSRELARGQGVMVFVGNHKTMQHLISAFYEEDFSLKTVPSGEEVLTLINQTPPDIIIMNYDLPGMNALEICRKIKDNPRATHIPVILWLNMARYPNKMLNYKPIWDADIDDVLTGPLRRDALLARVRSLLRKKQHQDSFLEHYDLLMQRAITDPLTGIYNRTYLDDILAREMTLSYRSARPISFLMIDIDFFKSVNDRYGHRIGDEILKDIALLIKRHVRASDVVARYGGEEFAVALYDSEQDAALEVARRICRSTAQK